MTEYRTEPASSRWHDRIPIGERMSAQPLLDAPMLSFEGDVRMSPLQPMLVPEEPRGGETDPENCFHCTTGNREAIWRDDHWHVGTPPTTGLPFWAGLAPNDHVLLHEMSPELAATMGPVIQRLAKAIQDLEGVARTHFSRWNDGGAHFHMHFLARPLGMMQGRGYMLAVWDDVLPATDPELLAQNRRQVAAAMAEVTGEALV